MVRGSLRKAGQEAEGSAGDRGDEEGGRREVAGQE